MDKKTYLGRECDNKVTVLSSKKDNYELNPRRDLRDHSPTGFAWGYAGSGPAQLALAILADYVNDEFAITHYQEFKSQCIVSLDGDKGFKLTHTAIDTHLKNIIKDKFDTFFAALKAT